MGSTHPASLTKGNTCSESPKLLVCYMMMLQGQLGQTKPEYQCRRSLWAVMGTWLCASPSSPLALAKDMKPPNIDTETRTDFGPSAAWITACVHGSQASGFRALVPGVVCAGRRAESSVQEEHPQDNCLCACKVKRRVYTAVLLQGAGGVPPSWPTTHARGSFNLIYPSTGEEEYQSSL